MKRTLIFCNSVCNHAREAAVKLLNTKAPIFAPAVLNRAQFSPEKISSRGASLVFPVMAAKDTTNAFRSMHGGALASLADMFTTLHLWGQDPQSRHVSVSFDIQYLASARAGGEYECVTRVIKKGKRLAFTEFEFIDCLSGEVVCKGTHTKAFI